MSVPSILAKSVVPAMKAVAARIRPAARPGFRSSDDRIRNPVPAGECTADAPCRIGVLNARPQIAAGKVADQPLGSCWSFNSFDCE